LETIELKAGLAAARLLAEKIESLEGNIMAGYLMNKILPDARKKE